MPRSPPPSAAPRRTLAERPLMVVAAVAPGATPTPPSELPQRHPHCSRPKAPGRARPLLQPSTPSPAPASLAVVATGWPRRPPACHLYLRARAQRFMADLPCAHPLLEDRCRCPCDPLRRRRSYPLLSSYQGWRLVHTSCFRQGQDESTSDDGTGFRHNEQAEISGEPDLKEEDQTYVKGDWFVIAQKIKQNLYETVSRFWNERWAVPWNERWAVPWTGQTITQVMFLWIATFWLVGSWIVPFLAHAAGFSKETLTHRGQALYSLLTDITEGLAGIAILHQCLGRFRPLPPGWFEFKLKGRWHWDVAFGCLLFPLVNLLSHINISLVHMSSGPVAGVSSVEQSIVARDPVAMALYALVVTVCAPIWEEIVFRGFLLPSLTRYMPLPWSILLSAAAFALAHFNVQRVLPLIFLGVVMGGVFARSRNLLASMVLHSLWNGFVFLDLMK